MIGCIDTTTPLIGAGCVISTIILGWMWGRFLSAPAQVDEDAGDQGADWSGEGSNSLHGEGK